MDQTVYKFVLDFRYSVGLREDIAFSLLASHVTTGAPYHVTRRSETIIPVFGIADPDLATQLPTVTGVPWR